MKYVYDDEERDIEEVPVTIEVQVADLVRHRLSPVTYDARSDTKNLTAFATSSG